jgi:hypothetical protein
MKRIKIIDVTILETSPHVIRQHLNDVLRQIRLNRLVSDPSNDYVIPPDITGHDPFDLDDDLADEIELSPRDLNRIRDRAEKLSKARLVAEGLLHLKTEERGRLEPVLKGMQIAMPGNVDWADRLAAELHEDMPWMARATEHVWHILRRLAERGDPITLRPILINGPPGIGKSVWARSLATRLSLPVADIGVTARHGASLLYFVRRRSFQGK